MISQPMPTQSSNPALYQPSKNNNNTPPPSPLFPDNFKLSPAAAKEKALVDAGRNQAALNYLNLQLILAKRLQQLSMTPLMIATLPMGEFRQLSEAIGPGSHPPHHPPFPPPFCFPPPPPPPPEATFKSSALQTGSEGPPQPVEMPPNRLSMLA